MAASEEMSSLFPIFILSVMGLFVVPWTIYRITTAATRKGKNLHCRCSECMRSPKYQTTLLKKVSLTLPFNSVTSSSKAETYKSIL
jgi:translocation protein SEC63